MTKLFSKVLVLAPHTDDGELGCGGTIARFLGEGKRPFVGFEMKPHAGTTSEMVIANAKRTLRDAWCRL